MPRLMDDRSFIQRNPEKCLKILVFTEDYQKRFHYCPTFREIGQAAGITSSSHVQWYIEQLIEDGYLSGTKGTNRTTHITDKGKRYIAGDTDD